MDDLDLSILWHLGDNSRASTTEIAKAVGVAPSTVHNRINRLKESGIIERFTVILDPGMVEQNVTAYIGINIESVRRIAIINQLRKIEEVLEIYELLEPYDLLVKVRTRDINSLKERVLKAVNGFDGVLGSSTILTTKRHKETSCAITGYKGIGGQT
ncbi:MAG: Lrp/AsnC family transcriptional regulator [Methanosarcinales archaeon]|jgi:Lrp/AsnC family transcriptional regulator for asnA, asnC and gidA|nr:Lrp/AsnC family transcriptional regulator [Methanosarcinales archaeon]MCK4652464.1 Lrp/AsnC family transcriptional regulator [Methanosarcinales archaeon]